MRSNVKPNLKLAIPFFRVTDIERTMRFYIDGLSFKLINKWAPKGNIEWCWLEREGVAIMLQEPLKPAEGKPGHGVSIAFQCADSLAIYHQALANGLSSEEPFVGNSMWVVVIKDPDGYVLDFESPTDVPEETSYSDWMRSSG